MELKYNRLHNTYGVFIYLLNISAIALKRFQELMNILRKLLLIPAQFQNFI